MLRACIAAFERKRLDTAHRFAREAKPWRNDLDPGGLLAYVFERFARAPRDRIEKLLPRQGATVRAPLQNRGLKFPPPERPLGRAPGADGLGTVSAVLGPPSPGCRRV